MKSIYKYFLTALFLSGFIFSQDITPPYFYCEDNGQNCNNAFNFSDEVNFDSGSGSFYFETILDVYDGEGSGVYSIGFELISPNGEIEDLTFFGNEMSTQIEGSLSNYVTEVWAFTGENAGGQVSLMLPISEFSLGTYQFKFIATDYAGNQLIIEPSNDNECENPIEICVSDDSTSDSFGDTFQVGTVINQGLQDVLETIMIVILMLKNNVVPAEVVQLKIYVEKFR